MDRTNELGRQLLDAELRDDEKAVVAILRKLQKDAVAAAELRELLPERARGALMLAMRRAQLPAARRDDWSGADRRVTITPQRAWTMPQIRGALRAGLRQALGMAPVLPGAQPRGGLAELRAAFRQKAAQRDGQHAKQSAKAAPLDLTPNEITLERAVADGWNRSTLYRKLETRAKRDATGARQLANGGWCFDRAKLLAELKRTRARRKGG